jgi:hypothetical protein
MQQPDRKERYALNPRTRCVSATHTSHKANRSFFHPRNAGGCNHMTCRAVACGYEFW